MFHFSRAEFAVAFWIAFFTILIGVFFLVLTVIIRARLLSRQKQRRELVKHWEPWLTKNLSKLEGSVPPVTEADERVVLQLLNYYYELLSGSARDRLYQLAGVLGAKSLAQKLLKSPKADDQILALHTLRQLADRTSWDVLLKLTGREDAVVSLAAARAFAKTDPVHAMPWVAPLIVERSDWACDKVAFLLKEAGPEAVSQPLVDAVGLAKKENLTRLIPYLRFADQSLARPLLHRIMQNHSDDFDIVRACIELFSAFRNTEDLLSVRAHLHHRDWRIRACAVVALKEIGAEEDQKELLSLLRDQEPWVRYQAAHALATLPFMSKERLEEMIQKQADHKSAKAMVQVMAERRIRGEE